MKNLTKHYDAHLHWGRYALANRVQQWRAEPGQSGFNLVASLALLAVLLPTAWVVVGRLGEAAGALIQGWPWSVAAATLVLLTVRQWRGLALWRQQRNSDWLATQPQPASVLRAAKLRCVLREGLLQASVAGFALSAMAMPVAVLLSIAALIVSAGVLGLSLARLPQAAQGAGWQRRQPHGPGLGRIARWQWIEAGAARYAPALAPGALALVLVPMGSSPLGAAAWLVVGLLCALLISAWQRMLSVIPAAASWLQSQPISAMGLLRDSASLPLALLAVIAALLLAAGLALQLGWLAPFIAAAVVAVGVLQLLCVCVERHSPRRASFRMLLYLALLVLCAQTLLPALPLLLAFLYIHLLLRLRSR